MYNNALGRDPGEVYAPAALAAGASSGVVGGECEQEACVRAGASTDPRPLSPYPFSSRLSLPFHSGPRQSPLPGQGAAAGLLAAAPNRALLLQLRRHVGRPAQHCALRRMGRPGARRRRGDAAHGDGQLGELCTARGEAAGRGQWAAARRGRRCCHERPRRLAERGWRPGRCTVLASAARGACVHGTGAQMCQLCVRHVLGLRRCQASMVRCHSGS
jgi:hypothetical protein